METAISKDRLLRKSSQELSFFNHYLSSGSYDKKPWTSGGFIKLEAHKLILCHFAQMKADVVVICSVDFYNAGGFFLKIAAHVTFRA